jgi:hypothetical protein
VGTQDLHNGNVIRRRYSEMLLSAVIEVMVTVVVICKNNVKHRNGCVTSVFEDEPRRILIIIQRFFKHCCFHLQGECVVVRLFLEALYRAGIRWRVGFDGADWQV